MPQTSRLASLALMDMSVLLIVAQQKNVYKLFYAFIILYTECPCRRILQCIQCSGTAFCFELDICKKKTNLYYRPSSDVRTTSHLKLKINTETALNNLYKKCNCVWRIALSANTKLWGLCNTSSLSRCLLAPLSKFIFGFTFAHLLSASCQRLNYWRAKILIVWSEERATPKARGHFGRKKQSSIG